MIFRLTLYYAAWTIRLGIPFWYYFQINAEWYNKEKGFYSKIDMDAHTPSKWRLQQSYFDKNCPPVEFPVFLKPEWGQNSNGVVRIDTKEDFLAFETNSKIPYIVQQAAIETQEYEIFYIRDADDSQQLAVLTITQAINQSDERHPINSINNADVSYQDCSDTFSQDELAKISLHLQALPNFRIARVGLRANSKADLLAGLFHIVEVNLFTPLPINLLDSSVSKKAKRQFINNSMYHLARVSGTTSKKHFSRFLFFKKLIKYYRSRVNL